MILNHKIILRSCAQHVYDELVQYYYYCPTQQMNETPNAHKQNVTRRPSRESVRALATTAAAPHVCCVCVVLCCSLLCGCCSVFGAGGSVQVNTRGYLCRFPGTRLPYSTRKPDQYPRGFGVMPESCRVLDWFSGFRLTGPNPTAHSTHTQHSTTTTRASYITHHTSHTAHPNGYVYYVVLGVRRELETTPLAVGKHSDTSSYIASDIYMSMYRQNPQPIDR